MKKGKLIIVSALAVAIGTLSGCKPPPPGTMLDVMLNLEPGEFTCADLANANPKWVKAGEYADKAEAVFNKAGEIPAVGKAAKIGSIATYGLTRVGSLGFNEGIQYWNNHCVE